MEHVSYRTMTNLIDDVHRFSPIYFLIIIQFNQFLFVKSVDVENEEIIEKKKKKSVVFHSLLLLRL